MSKTLTFTCALHHGVHARPASHVERLCNAFAANITWCNTRTGATGNAKSALALIGTDTLHQDACEITIDGPDEEEAHRQLVVFLRDEFPHVDSDLTPAAPADTTLAPLPRSLSNLNPATVRGTAVSDGIAFGALVRIGDCDFDNLDHLPAAGTLEGERKRLLTGVEKLRVGMAASHRAASGMEATILSAHLSIVNDAEFVAQLESGLKPGGRCAEAVIAAARHFADLLGKSQSAYMRERELDIRDVCIQLLQNIYGEQAFDNRPRLAGESICLARDLTPSQFLDLDKKHLKGLVLTNGGSTSHTVILARSFGIPTLVGVDETVLRDVVGREVVIDASLGLVVTRLDEPVERYYRQELTVRETIARQFAAFQGQPATTRDGRRVEVAANIAIAEEAAPAFAAGAESIGLFRTEMLYVNRQVPPEEDELYNIYCRALEAAAGRPIIVRTMDIGGDKHVDFLKIPPENNPFLGYRAVRIYPEYIELFKTQLRSILRASAHGPLKIMIPMIASLEEILWVKDVLGEVRKDLRTALIPFDEKIPLGIMLEVPSVAFIIDQECEEIDFFSIGSNDLTQYLMAVDRENGKVAKTYNSLNPAFLRALDHVVREVHRHGKWVGLCGELGGKGSILPLLVGLGLDEISMSAPSIPGTKARMAKLDSRECRQLLNRAMACRTALEVETLITQFRMTQDDTSLLSSDCIAIDVDLRSREEVIKAMVDNAYLAGRCRYPGKLAEDVWAREDVFATSLGFGFAIPHAKSEHIEQSTIGVVKLPKAIPWGEEEAQIVIMLTLNKMAAGDQHMKIFSKLARRIMNAGFRESLLNAPSAAEIENVLKAELMM